MATLNSLTSSFILAFISYQGLILLIDPEIRNRLYTTVAEVSNVAVPLVESLAEDGRLIVSLILIPTVFYPKSWSLPRFVSLIAYVVYICIIYNLYLFHEITHIGQFIFHLFVLTKTIFIIVDDLTQVQLKERRLKRQQSIQEAKQKQVEQKPKESPEKKQKKNEPKVEAKTTTQQQKGNKKKNKLG